MDKNSSQYCYIFKKFINFKFKRKTNSTTQKKMAALEILSLHLILSSLPPQSKMAVEERDEDIF